ncbi:MAG: hypothetical protein F6J98_15425 [Moorea sp. SIO4G2]|uniref:hypothetical protein n=1 Tax=Moorena TaxID=1155738 RepID=UPI001300F379|nr:MULTISPECIES: hypothetical protein [Moorena]NEO11662.1 hypothetical protein [Moorena sp. SIO3E8]NEO49613.1 hypothetical protein [Moorena sp. SIO4A3]NEO61745.1 hypothetical protein [Moorena sp. SIO4G2]NEQ03498.1 hypothetical protein [Moorena sp. SIO3F7]NEO25031.1 hypothetical protein [Moorena sp. SIO4A5]
MVNSYIKIVTEKVSIQLSDISLCATRTLREQLSVFSHWPLTLAKDFYPDWQLDKISNY